MKLYQTAFSLLAFCGMLAACSDDDWKDDVSALQQPVPSSIVMLDEAGGTIVKGNSFQLRFRVNPSSVVLTKDDVQLDVQDSDTYFRFDKTDVSDTRASYVTPSDYYTLENVEPAKNENGEVLEGQWVATVRTQGEANFRNVSDLHLVVNYTDAAGVAQQVSSSGVPIEIVPTVDEGVNFGYATVQNLLNSKGAVNPYILFVDVNAYKNSLGVEWHYSRQYITTIHTTVNKEELTADTTTVYTAHYLSFTPVTSAPVWTGLTEGNVKHASSECQIKLTDFGNTTKSLSLPVSYCPNNIPLDLRISAAEANAALAEGNSDYNYELTDVLADYGIGEDLFAHLARIGLTPNIESTGMGEVPLLLDELEGCNADSFRPVARFWLAESLTPGTSSEEGDHSLSIFVSSIPQELTSPLFSLLELNIQLNIHITD